MNNLSKMAKQVFGGGEEIDRILGLPMTQLALELKNAYQKIEEQPFGKMEFNDFIAKIATLGKLDKQVAAASYAAEHGEAENDYDVELNTREKQLLWAAVLTRMMSEKPKEDVTQSRLWKQIKGCLGLHNENIRVATVIAEAMQNDNVTFAWGSPGTWFYYNPKENHINLDLYHSMMVGFEHVRSVHLHEIGHSQLTNSYPPEMRKIHDSMEGFVNKVKSGAGVKATKEEQKQYALDAAYWNLWFGYFNRVEDVCVDQFAFYMENRVNQDFADSMNHAATLLRGYAEIYSGKSVEDQLKKISSDQAQPDILGKILGKQAGPQKAPPAKQKEHLDRITRPLTAAEVKDIKAGNISPENASKIFEEIANGALLAAYVHNGLISNKAENWEKFHIFAEDVNRLVDVSGVPAAKGLTAFEYLYKLSVDEKDSLRTLQPRPSDRFRAPLGKSLQQNYRDIVKDTTEKRCDVMQHIWDLYLKPYADVLKKEFEKKVEQQLNQQQQQGQGQGQEQQPGEGSGNVNKPQQGQGQGSGVPQQGDGEPQEVSEDLKDMVKNMSKDPAQQREKQQRENKEKAPGAESDKQEKPEKQQVGDLKDRKIAKEELSEEDKKEMRKKGKDMPDVAKGALNAPASGAGSQRGVDLESLQKGDWRDYNKRIAELSPVIMQVAKKYIAIRDEQRRQILRQAKSHEFMADDGDVMGMLDRDKVLNTKFRQASKASLSADDFKKFHEQRVETVHSTIEIVNMIDGSGSMTMVQLGKSDAMGAALQAAVIQYEAAKIAGIDSYIVIWGGEPIVIAHPNSNPKEVGEMLERLRKGTGSGTNLAPGIAGTIEATAAHSNKNGTISGSTHITVFSDGDIFDAGETGRMLEIIGRSAKNLSIDVAVLGPKGAGESTMEEVFKEAIKKTNGRMLGVIRGHDPSVIPVQLADAMYKRVRGVKVETEPDSKKRARLKQLHNKLTKN